MLAPPDTRYARNVNAVSVPYYAGEFGEPVSFSCGALPADLPDDRILSQVGPALRDVVSGIEQRTGRAPALSRRG